MRSRLVVKQQDWFRPPLLPSSGPLLSSVADIRFDTTGWGLRPPEEPAKLANTGWQPAFSRTDQTPFFIPMAAMGAINGPSEPTFDSIYVREIEWLLTDAVGSRVYFYS